MLSCLLLFCSQHMVSEVLYDSEHQQWHWSKPEIRDIRTHISDPSFLLDQWLTLAFRTRNDGEGGDMGKTFFWFHCRSIILVSYCFTAQWPRLLRAMLQFTHQSVCYLGSLQQLYECGEVIEKHTNHFSSGFMRLPLRRAFYERMKASAGSSAACSYAALVSRHGEVVGRV